MSVEISCAEKPVAQYDSTLRPAGQRQRNSAIPAHIGLWWPAAPGEISSAKSAKISGHELPRRRIFPGLPSFCAIPIASTTSETIPPLRRHREFYVIGHSFQRSRWQWLLLRGDELHRRFAKHLPTVHNLRGHFEWRR
jgi:hypothetical protein